MKRVLKPVVALAAVLGLLSFLAPPSAASSGTLTGGTLTVSTSTPITTTFGGTSTTSMDCGTGTGITLLDNSTGTTGSTSVAGTTVVGIDAAFLHLGTWYHFTGTSTGTYASTHTTGGNYNVTATVSFTGRIYTPASQTNPCASGTSICGPIVSTNMGLTGTASLTAVHPGPIGTVTFGGNKIITAFGCTGSFAGMNGATATLTSVTATLT